MEDSKIKLRTHIDQIAGRIYIDLEDLVCILNNVITAGIADKVDVRQVMLLFEWFAGQHSAFEEKIQKERGIEYAKRQETIRQLRDKYSKRGGKNGVLPGQLAGEIKISADKVDVDVQKENPS